MPAMAGQEKQPSVSEPKSSRSTGTRETVSIQFPGGTVADYVKAISGGRVRSNVVLDFEVGAIRVPPVSLSGVSFGNALRALTATAEAREKGVVVQVLDSGREGGEDVFVLTSSVPGRAKSTQAAASVPKSLSAPRLVRAWSVRRWDGTKVESVAKALQETMASIGSTGEKPSVTIDRSLGLLIVYGAPAQIETAAQIVGEVQPPDNVPRSESTLELQRLAEEIDGLKAAIARLTRERNK